MSTGFINNGGEVGASIHVQVNMDYLYMLAVSYVQPEAGGINQNTAANLKTHYQHQRKLGVQFKMMLIKTLRITFETV